MGVLVTTKIVFQSRRSFLPALFGFPQRYQVGDFPQPIRHAGSHGRRHAQSAVNLGEVVGEISKGYGSGMVLQFARKAVRLLEAGHVLRLLLARSPFKRKVGHHTTCLSYAVGAGPKSHMREKGPLIDSVEAVARVGNLYSGALYLALATPEYHLG